VSQLLATLQNGSATASPRRSRRWASTSAHITVCLILLHLLYVLGAFTSTPLNTSQRRGLIFGSHGRRHKILRGKPFQPALRHHKNLSFDHPPSHLCKITRPQHLIQQRLEAVFHELSLASMMISDDNNSKANKLCAN